MASAGGRSARPSPRHDVDPDVPRTGEDRAGAGGDGDVVAQGKEGPGGGAAERAGSDDDDVGHGRLQQCVNGVYERSVYGVH